MVSDNLAQLQHLARRGGRCSRADGLSACRSPASSWTTRIKQGAHKSHLRQQSVPRDLERRFRERAPRDSKPGARPADVRQRIQEQYAGQRQAFVLTNGELETLYPEDGLDQWFGLTSVHIVVAVLVVILGVVNTLTVSITDRRRELGRAPGGGRAPRPGPAGPSGSEALSIGSMLLTCCSASRWARSTWTTSSRSCITISLGMRL